MWVNVMSIYYWEYFDVYHVCKHVYAVKNWLIEKYNIPNLIIETACSRVWTKDFNVPLSHGLVIKITSEIVGVSWEASQCLALCHKWRPSLWLDDWDSQIRHGSSPSVQWDDQAWRCKDMTSNIDIDFEGFWIIVKYKF